MEFVQLQICCIRSFPSCKVDDLLKVEKISFGHNITMEVLYTPGSVCFAMNINGFSSLIAGDTM